MKNFIYLVFVFLLAASCKPGIPNDIIEPDKMALVLHDIHLADAYLQTIYVPDSAKKTASAFYGGIYKKFEIDSALYQKSLDYYLINPRVMNGIYEKVTAELTKEKTVITRIDSIEYAKELKIRQKKMKADSVKRADSVKKSLLIKNKDSLKKALKKSLKIKKADSLKKASEARKLRIKRRTELLKGVVPVKIKN
ncbi:DUF4296 domain-containing protein [Pedobacter psychroterrae]|uniref:DUF4296 domain-containing protein n=1 Tax=Pedobacter psychroterrae TaxID=2530453 RepID=A0A4R0NQV2_9SPHI|nr:DUF4296 domain-containing protein [Pedobacter psychroterrae]TCD01464.1 DUF4296 domain-containing protein [Pedobacter psychroterrae]